jgi:hypothetical protein
MAAFTVIADVGEALLAVLADEMQADPDVGPLIDSPDRLSLESPADLESDDTVRLSVYLYRISEDPFSKNRPAVGDGGKKLRKPPLALDLYYLVTPLLLKARDQQIVLGKAMQTLYDRPTLEGTDLPPTSSLAKAGESVRVVLNPVSLEETTRVWQALEMSYRLSVCYVVRVALAESARTDGYVPVARKDAAFGPAVGSP